MELTITHRSAAYRGMLASVAIVAAAVSLAAWGPGEGAKATAATATGTSDARASAGNWNFERGTFARWQTRASGSGAWHVYSDGTKPPDPHETDPQFPFKVPQPPEGRFAAVTDMTAPGSRILHRDLKLDDDRVKLRFTLFYVNHVGEFFSPATLNHEIRRPNQQFRVDLMDPAAPLDSVAPKHVLARIFRTVPGDTATTGPRAIAFDLSRWAGQQVRLRFAQVDNIGPMRVVVDDVRLQAIGS